MATRMYVDFKSMAMDEQGRVFIGREGSPQDDRELLQSLRQGSAVVLHDEEMEVTATVEIVRVREGYKAWLGRPGWSTRCDFAHQRPLTAAN